MPSPGFTLAQIIADDGSPRLVLAGSLTLADGGALWQQLRRALAQQSIAVCDVSAVSRLDGGAAALLQALAVERGRAGAPLRWLGASGEVGRMLALYDCARSGSCAPVEPPASTLLGDVGDFAHGAWRTTQAILAFLGDLVVGVLAALRRPRTVHTGELGVLFERAGADGLPIVMLINFLVGAILGLQGAIQLHRFGGDQFLANLVGLSVVRELGPLMTAILVTGRSGAAYAAELGTMTVNEEVDALRTLGQDPQRFLVFPRVLTLLCVVPLLTVVGDLLGSVGGLFVAMTYLDQPMVVYLQSLQQAVSLGDVGTGLLKSFVFGGTIALVSCQRGLATRGGADGVGRATTSAVVVVLFALVVLDGVFTWVFSLLDW
ncbi:MAG: MlaE family lipid ABC transporter permease subunit [Planctomycetes bacterium]|nr:MlaE family lipid ABC transporter permease subunit [Planctomycetota bacterium]